MKKTIKSIIAIAVAAFAFTACSDVPSPYQVPGEGSIYTEPTDESVVTKVDFKKNGQGEWSIANVNKPDAIENIWTFDAKYGMVAKASIQVDGSYQNYASESWLVSPAFDLTKLEGKEAKLVVRHAASYFNTSCEAECDILVSTDYNPTRAIADEATWEVLDVDGWSAGNFAWVDGVADMTKYAGKDKVYVAFKYTSVAARAGTWEIESLSIEEGSAEKAPDDTNYGTAEAPITVAEAMAIIEKTGQTESPEAYVKGIVSGYNDGDPFSAQYGNLSYYISDDGTANGQIGVYRGYGLNGAKFTSGTDLKPGDVVVVIGKLVNFRGNTPQVTTGSKLYSLNGETAGGGSTEPVNPEEPITGQNLLTNGDFETWSGNLPDNWKSASSASNATLAQTTDAHGGTYAVKVTHDAANNKRLAYKELKLKAGTYSMAFYAKAADATGTASVNPGYVPITDGKAGTYAYGGYVNDITDWKQVVNNFTLAADATVCLVVMLPKNSANDVVIDDFTLTTADGGIIEGGEEPTPEPQPQPTGNTGTADNPLTVAEIHAAVAAMAADTESTVDYYTRGKVCSIKYTFSAQYGTATFDISDDGTTNGTKFTCYGTYYLDNQSWKEGDQQIAVGDEVIVCGKVVNYKGSTPEFSNKKNYLIKLTPANSTRR